MKRALIVAALVALGGCTSERGRWAESDSATIIETCRLNGGVKEAYVYTPISDNRWANIYCNNGGVFKAVTLEGLPRHD